ncbi:hypothetical protein ACFRCI_31935 [Streptomyces sp. NPDC056638]|uniref:hypothetical protein n=1 Tax=Streptomyces sp. NPDC056638 TaxID=3345887 RepID=UPI0036C56A1C
MYIVCMGIGAVLLPVQVELVDSADEVADFGLVSGVSAIFATPPGRPPARPPRWTSIGHGQAVRDACEPVGEDSFAIALGFCEELPGDPCTETVKDADATALLRDGRIAVAPVAADRTDGVREPHPGTLRKIRHYVEHDAPRN